MDESNFTRDVEQDPVLRLFLDSLTDQAVFSVDTSGVITTWNEGCVRLKKYSADEAIGQNFRMLYEPADQERGRPEDNLRSALNDGQFHEEQRRVRKGGEVFVAEVSIYPLEVNGQLKGFAKIVRDISVRKRIEAERDAFEAKLHQTTQDLEGFCYSIAHDLRSPIRAIISLSSIIKEDFAEHLPEPVNVYLDRMKTKARHLGGIVDDVMDFARLGHGKLTPKDADLSAIANHLADELRPLCHFGQGSIEVQNGMRADVDSTMIETVLRNLLENSCKYSEPGVVIDVGMDSVGGEDVFHVSDNGIGFDMKYSSKLFEAFHRLHGADEYEGSGIGLANVRRIIERHGGKVWAESVVGTGSTFFFTLGAHAHAA